MAEKEPLYGKISVSERAELTDFKLARLLIWAGVQVRVPKAEIRLGPGDGWGEEGQLGRPAGLHSFSDPGADGQQRAINVSRVVYSADFLFAEKEIKK